MSLPDDGRGMLSGSHRLASADADRETRALIRQGDSVAALRSGSESRGSHKAVAASSDSMFWQHRKISADDVARDFSVTAQTFADTFVQYIGAAHGDDGPVLVERRRLESCALLWAAIESTFLASALTDEEREKVVPLIRDSLVPAWRKFRLESDDFITRVRERSASYLRHRDAFSQLKTATGFMGELVANLDVDAVKLLPVKTLTALLAHRMLSDLRRLNELKSGYSIT